MQTMLNAVLRHPGAALQHLRAYGRLAHIELTLVLQAWQRRTLLIAGALVCVGVCAGFLGMVLMAWALVPSPLSAHQWLALLTPAGLAALLGGACLIAWHRTPMPDPLEHLSRQWQLDAGWLLPEQDEAP